MHCSMLMLLIKKIHNTHWSLFELDKIFSHTCWINGLFTSCNVLFFLCGWFVSTLEYQMETIHCWKMSFQVPNKISRNRFKISNRITEQSKQIHHLDCPSLLVWWLALFNPHGNIYNACRQVSPAVPQNFYRRSHRRDIWNSISLILVDIID